MAQVRPAAAIPVRAISVGLSYAANQRFQVVPHDRFLSYFGVALVSGALSKGNGIIQFIATVVLGCIYYGFSLEASAIAGAKFTGLSVLTSVAAIIITSMFMEVQEDR